MKKTVTSTISTFYLLWTILLYLPQVIGLIKQIREAFPPETTQPILQAFKELLNKIAPPAPTPDGTSTTPVNPDVEKQKRWFRFKDRMTVATTITDADATELCNLYCVQSYNIA
jgi:hypothetical protein